MDLSGHHSNPSGHLTAPLHDVRLFRTLRSSGRT
jgi:hypothetical protein